MSADQAVIEGRHVRRVAIFGYMEAADVSLLRRSTEAPAGSEVRFIGHRIWQSEARCVEALLAVARAVRAGGGSFVWVLPAPELRAAIESAGEVGHIVASDPADRALTAEWA